MQQGRKSVETLIKYDWTFTEWLAKLQEPNPYGDDDTRGSNRESDEWNGNVTYKEFISLVKDGWPDGLKKMNEWHSEIKRRFTYRGLGISMELEDCGEEVSVPHYLEGIPECMFRFQESEQKKPITINVNGVASSCISSNTMMRRGAAIAVMVDTLNANGYNVEINLFDVTSLNRDRKFVSKVTIKTHNETLDMERLIMLLAHPATFRRGSFRIMEHIFEKSDLQGQAYGCPANLEKNEQGDIYIGSMHGSESDEWNGDQVVKKITDTLKPYVNLELETA